MAVVTPKATSSAMYNVPANNTAENTVNGCGKYQIRLHIVAVIKGERAYNDTTWCSVLDKLCGYDGVGQ